MSIGSSKVMANYMANSPQGPLPSGGYAPQATPQALPQFPAQQAAAPAANVPQTGLTGYENAMSGGLQGALTLLNPNAPAAGQGGQGIPAGTHRISGTPLGNNRAGVAPRGQPKPYADSITGTRDYAIALAGDGIKPLNPYVNRGTKANSVQAALSGALGPEAQAQAYQNFQSSPGQQWLVEQGERALTRNAAATGGLGGGNVLKELAKYGQGMAQQDFQNHFNRLGDVSGQGIDAANIQAQLRGQQSSAASAAGGHMAQVKAATIAAQAQYAAALENARTSRSNAQLNADTALKRDAAGYAFDAGQNTANKRYDTGLKEAEHLSGTTSDLTKLINEQGIGVSDIYAGAGTAIANAQIQAGRDQGTSASNTAIALANLGVGSNGDYVGKPIPDVSQIPGNIDNVGKGISGVGNVLGAFGL